MSDHYCAICGEEAPVGLGNPPTWLCLDHFAAQIGVVGERVAELRDLARRSIDDWATTESDG